MKLNIQTKFLIAFLSVLVSTLLSLFIYLYISLEKNFNHYLSSKSHGSLSYLTQNAAQLYSEHGNWDVFRLQPDLWLQLQKEATDFSTAGSQHQTQKITDVFDVSQSQIALLNSNMYTILGKHLPTEQMDVTPINISGETVGYISFYAPEKISSNTDRDFLAEAKNILLTAILIALGSALILTTPLVHCILKPLAEIIKGMKALSHGKFETRIHVNSSDELGILSSELNNFAETLASTEDKRRQWIADISHELRTPLSVLKGQLEAIIDKVREPTPQQLKILHNKVGDLESLIDDLYQLSLSDLNAITYRKEKISIKEVLEEVIESFEQPLRSSKLLLDTQLDISPKYVVRADEQKLLQLFSNLFKNSMRYTDSDGILRLSARSDKNTVIVNIEDSPPGVENEQLPHIFERLFRGDISRSRSYGGSGLGLSICKNIVEAHNGHIVASNSSLGGLDIMISLPLEPTTLR